MEYKQIKVTCKTANLDEVCAIMSVVDPGLMIEDYSDIEETFKDVYADLIEDDLMKADKTKASVSVFISEERPFSEFLQYITERLTAARIEAATEVIGVCDEDWANSWKKYYHPIKIGKRIVIVPAWEEYQKEDGELTVTMDPGMAFGTGTHETTRLVAALIEKYITPGDKVLDVGTGSGILSIIASLLDAKQVYAYDIDPTAVKIAKENTQINKRNNISVDVSNLLSGVEKIKFNLICANIVADIIMKMSPELADFASDGCTFIASGIITERRDEVIEAMKKTPFTLTEQVEENGWCALVYKK